MLMSGKSQGHRASATSAAQGATGLATDANGIKSANGGSPSELVTINTRVAKLVGAERRLSRWQVALARLGVLVAFLALWQYLPEVRSLQSYNFLNRLFISSPTEVVRETIRLVSATGGVPSVWPYFGRTMIGTLVGGAVGVSLGALGGLLLSNYRWLSDILRPYLVAVNSIPRIALIPVVILIAGPTVKGTSLNAAIVVFFVVFFNAYEGGVSLPSAMAENVALLGASRGQMMRKVRWAFVVAWTFAALPNAVSFSLIAVVTTEILSGVQGMGYLILEGLTNLDSTLIFGVVVILSITGILLNLLLSRASRILTHGINVYGGTQT